MVQQRKIWFNNFNVTNAFVTLKLLKRAEQRAGRLFCGYLLKEIQRI